jgi:hypothetical protein
MDHGTYQFNIHFLYKKETPMFDKTRKFYRIVKVVKRQKTPLVLEKV